MPYKLNSYNNKDESFVAYLKYLDNVTVLTKEEEMSLFMEYKKVKGVDLNREKEILNQIFNSAARLVFHIASKYSKYYNENIMDLIQEGNDGLIEAINRFDPCFNQKLSTYSTWWIKQRILKYLSQNAYFIRFSLNKIVKINNFKKTINYLSEQLSRQPTIEELAKFLNISEKKVIELFKYSLPIVSLNSLTRVNDNDLEMQDLIEDENVRIEESFIKQYSSELIRKEISNLSPKEQIILNLRFGISSNNESYSLEQVGYMFNLTRERIRQIQKRATSKLKNKKILEELTC